MIENVVITSKTSPQASVGQPGKLRHRILVVDDDSYIRQLKVNLLLSSDYDVESVNDGAYGWAALQVKTYDLVITDNTMPRMTGVEMIEKLRSARLKVPVIMATGYMPIFEFNRKPWLKPDAALTIPFSDSDLLAAIKEILSRKGGYTPPPALV